jgi:hypothetical protein
VPRYISRKSNATRSIAKEQDILKMAPPVRPPELTSRRIGIHTSSAGGVENAAERAYRLGCNTLQIFSSSPRQWKQYELGRPQCEQMMQLREKYKPFVARQKGRWRCALIILCCIQGRFAARTAKKDCCKQPLP